MAKSKLRTYAEQAVFYIAGSEASRRQAMAMGAAQGAASQQGTGGRGAIQSDTGDSFKEWVIKTFPMITKEDNAGFSTIEEENFSPEDRGKINELLIAMKNGIEIDGRKVKFDDEQFIMDMWSEHKAWKEANPQQPVDVQPDLPRMVDRSANRGIASLMVTLLTEPAVTAIRSFIDQLKGNGYDTDQLYNDLWKMYQSKKKDNPAMDDTDNPAVKILMSIADNSYAFETQKGYVYNLGLLTKVTETPAAATGDSPIIKVLKEVVQLNTIPERIKHLQKSQRVTEMRTGKVLIREFVKNPLAFALASGMTVLNIVLTVIVIIFVLAL